MGFTEIFGGSTIAPSNASFLLLPMATDIDLDWPIEQAMSGLVVADTIEVVAASPGLSINFPDARQVSTGYTTCLNNTGAQTVTIKDAGGNTLLSLVSGSAWVIYLNDNSTEAGSWRVFQLGASVSVAVAAALAGAGLKAVGATLNQSISVTSTATTPIAVVNADRARLFNWTGGVGVLNLPDPAVVGSDWYIQVRNSGTGDLTATPPSGTIDAAANKTFGVGTSATIVTDGTNFFTLGFGSGSGGGSGSFDFTTVDVAGSGNFALTGANLNRIAYRFTGILTGDRTIIVPGSIQQYWITNATTGAFNLFIKTTPQAAPGLQVLQNNAAILYCDGNNVVDADSATVVFPIAVALGGTGAVNAATARTNLGAGATGATIFQAATQVLAQTALGIGLADPNTWAGANVYTQPASGTSVAILLSSTSPIIAWNETDAAANNRRWDIAVDGEQMVFRVVNDAVNAATNWLVVNRTLNVVDTVNFPSGVLQYAGNEVGYRNLIFDNIAGNLVLDDTFRGRGIRYVGAGGHTWNFPASVIQTYGIITILNGGTGNLTLAGSGGAFFEWYNGSGSIPVGSRTLAPGAVATVVAFSATAFSTWGGGIT